LATRSKNVSVIIFGSVFLNGRMKDLTENASGGPGFIDEKRLLARLPVNRRTLANWKAKCVLPFIKIGILQ
jgi:hypothetical protein